VACTLAHFIESLYENKPFSEIIEHELAFSQISGGVPPLGSTTPALRCISTCNLNSFSGREERKKVAVLNFTSISVLNFIDCAEKRVAPQKHGRHNLCVYKQQLAG